MKRAHALPECSPQRFYPRQGTSLNRGHIRGPWRPTGAVSSCGFFSVLWSTPSGDYWAPLHDFDQRTRDELIEECARADQHTDCSAVRQWGRAANDAGAVR
jgi:hypothetical protein